jgi:hypothetical protein
VFLFALFLLLWKILMAAMKVWLGLFTMLVRQELALEILKFGFYLGK